MLKKSAILFCIIILTLSLCSCDKPIAENKNGCTVAMIGRRDSIEDGRYNEYITSGISKYCDNNNVAYDTFIPTDDSEQSRTDSAIEAINNGAKVVIAAGSGFSVPFYNLQNKYKDVYFILFDACVHPEETFTGDGKYVAENTVCISFRNEDIGFLSGCAAILSGCKNPAFIGGLNNESERAFCYGFLQGIDYAAKNAGLNENDVKVSVSFSKNYLDKEENSSCAKSLIESGTDCIFASDRLIISYVSNVVSSETCFICGGFNYYNNRGNASICIGERIDRIVPKLLEKIFTGSFSAYSGKDMILGIKNNAIGLIEDSSADIQLTKNDLSLYSSAVSDGKIVLKSEIEMVSNLGAFTVEEVTDNLELHNITIEIY